MSSQQTAERIEEQVEEFWNERTWELAEEFVASEFVGHMIGEREDLHGREAYVAWARSVEEMFPDFELAFDPTFTADGVLCGQWTLTGTHEGELPNLGVEPTGNPVEFSGLFVDRIADGRVAEMWHQVDYLTLLRQIEALPD
jgi:predicted ester cyclase